MATSVLLFIAASTTLAVNCWVFQYNGSNCYPSPAGSGDHIKETMSLCVLGDDAETYPALIRSIVINSNGQKVYERTETHASSYNFEMVVWEVGGSVASDVYTVKTRAESALCGNSSWEQHTVQIVN